MSEKLPAVPLRTANVELTVKGRRLRLKFSVPEARVQPGVLLPLFRAVSAALTKAAISEVEKAGHKISCTKGCGACCLQLVPISAVEAREVGKVVERMPEPRRSEVKQRFAEASKRLDEAGLLPRLRDPDTFEQRQMQSLDLEYFALRIPCPFLEDESCSIYEDRPIACREYLVVSAAEHCSEPTPVNVRAISPLAEPVATRIPSSDVTADGRRVAWVPLILAMEYAGEHTEEPTARPATEIMEEFFKKFAPAVGGQKTPISGGS